MKIISGSKRYARGIFVRQSEARKYCFCNENNIVYIDQEVIKMQKVSDVKCKGVIISENIMFSHIVSLFLSMNIFVLIAQESELAGLQSNNEIFLDLREACFIENFEVDLEELLYRNREDYSRVSTKDGVMIELLSTIKNEQNAIESSVLKLKKVGIVSTEFLLFYDEEYSKEKIRMQLESICSQLTGCDIAIRLYDVANDKMPKWIKNKFSDQAYDVRGIRLAQVDGFECYFADLCEIVEELQEEYNLSILIPFVSNLEDVLFAKRLFKIEKNSKPTHFGAMIEHPAALSGMGNLEKEVDFFSIGTNDMMQYFFGSYRDDMTSSKYLDPYSCEFLSFIANVNENIKNKTKICGQLTLYPYMIEILIVLGYRQFSITPNAIPLIYHRIQSFDSSKLNRMKEMISVMDNKELVKYIYSKI